MKGSYVLIIEMKDGTSIEVGRLGKIYFRKGYYAYIGSALNSLEKRIERHLKKEKKLRWHIDYLLKHANILEIFYIESSRREECNIANHFSSLKPIEKFGASDCKCKSHLFYSENLADFKEIIKRIGLVKLRLKIFK